MSQPNSTDTPNQSLSKLREEIDQIDGQLLSLLDQRARLVLEVGHWKQKNARAVYDPDREKQILDKVAALPRQHLSEKDTRNVFQILIGFFRSLESDLQNKKND